MPQKKSRDAIALAKADHRTVEKLFSRYQGLGERAVKGAQDVVARVVKELSIHAAIEEQVLYPALRRALSDGEQQATHAIEEHQKVKDRLVRIERLNAEKQRDELDREMDALIETVSHHVKEEEKELFPRLRKEMERKQLVELGERMASAKKVAPTHPHPHAPDTPPGNIVMGAAAGVMDRARDVLAGRKRG